MRGLVKLIALGCLALSLCAHSPEFDVASIKPNPSLPLMTIGPGLGPRGWTGTKVTLLDLLMSAYNLTAPRVIGPGWLDGDRFDIVAKPPEGSSPEDLRTMAQTLLKKRFHLIAHMETREMPVYELVVAKEGLKMIKHPAPGSEPVPEPPRKKYPGVKNIASLGGTLTTAQIADFLSRRAGRPILDKTGLEGKYDMFITWMPSLPTGSDEAETGPPDLFIAVQETLGLKLQPSTAQLSVVVVDHMDRMPTEN